MQVAHHANQIVDILCHEKNLRLVIDVVLPADVGKGHQQSPCAAGWVIDRYPALVLDFLRQPRDICCDLCHTIANIIRREELTRRVVAKLQAHIQLPEKVLIRVFFQSHNEQGKDFGEKLHI